MDKILLLDYLKLSFGCCFGPKGMITLDGNSVTFCKDLFYNAENKQKKEVSDESKEVLISELNNLNVLNWDNHYMNPVLDGDEWDLEIVYNDGNKKLIKGYNSYPGSQPDSTEKTPEFNSFLTALNNLINSPGFFS
jgi:hypothetical protein